VLPHSSDLALGCLQFIAIRSINWSYCFPSRICPSTETHLALSDKWRSGISRGSLDKQRGLSCGSYCPLRPPVQHPFPRKAQLPESWPCDTMCKGLICTGVEIRHGNTGESEGTQSKLPSPLTCQQRKSRGTAIRRVSTWCWWFRWIKTSTNFSLRQFLVGEQEYL